MLSPKDQSLPQPVVYREKQLDAYLPPSNVRSTLQIPRALRKWFNQLDRFRYEDQPLSLRTLGFIFYDMFLKFIWTHIFVSLLPEGNPTRHILNPVLFTIVSTIADLSWKKIAKKWRVRRTEDDDEAEVGLMKGSNLLDEKVNLHAVWRGQDEGVELAEKQGFSWRWWTGVEIAQKQGHSWRWWAAFCLWHALWAAALGLTMAWWKHETIVREIALSRGTHGHVSHSKIG